MGAAAAGERSRPENRAARAARAASAVRHPGGDARNRQVVPEAPLAEEVERFALAGHRVRQRERVAADAALDAVRGLLDLAEGLGDGVAARVERQAVMQEEELWRSPPALVQACRRRRPEC